MEMAFNFTCCDDAKKWKKLGGLPQKRKGFK
jgi:hypothetical protein